MGNFPVSAQQVGFQCQQRCQVATRMEEAAAEGGKIYRLDRSTFFRLIEIGPSTETINQVK